MFNVSYSCPACPERYVRDGEVVQVFGGHSSATALGRVIHGLVRHRAWITGRRIEREFNRKWGDLAQYNAEKGRVVHTPEYAAAMEAKQARWNAVRGAEETREN